ncbi:hypothetical protein K474DRAFT_1714172 [Panus rudis PR-1116 ss-1]|nr:hypothetical protein K474DRAFT_1714172 [Panus rudis PR-1116 ss-1]
MPSVRPARALLLLTCAIAAMAAVANVDPPLDAPWCWPAWQYLTGCLFAPWEPAPDGQQHPFPATADERSSFKAFMQALMAAFRAGTTASLFKASNDNHATARTRLLKWITDNWEAKWGINSHVAKLLKDLGKDPYEVMAEFGQDQLVDLADADVTTVYPEIARSLFGDDAFMRRGGTVKPAVREFVASIVAGIWHNRRRAINRETARIDKMQREFEERFAAFGNYVLA